MSTKGLDSFSFGENGGFEILRFSARKTSVICFSFFLGLGVEGMANN